MTRKPKRKNPADLTTRNARASKRRDDALHDLIERLMIRVEKLERMLEGKVEVWHYNKSMDVKPKRGRK